MLDILEIKKRNRQRYPFEMLDRILECIPNQKAVGIKNVSINEPYFVGHFPNLPIMPGVLIIEAAAQLCSFVMSYSNEITADLVPVLLKVDRMKFIHAVTPGDVMRIEVASNRNAPRIAIFSVKITVDNKKVAEGCLLFSFANVDKLYH